MRSPNGSIRSNVELGVGVAPSAPITTLEPTSANPDTTEEEPKVGILLLNLGGPEKSDDVEGTYDNFHFSFLLLSVD